MTQKVTADTILGDILKMPNGQAVLSKHKLPCLSCPMAALEMGILKLGDVSRLYGIDLEAVLAELNKEEDAETQT